MQIKAIGFDYGGVVRGLPLEYLGNRLTDLLGVTISQYQNAYYAHNKKINRGEVSWEQLWTLVLNDLGKIEHLDEVMDLTARLYDESKINEDVLSLADKLRSDGYKTGLLSNTTLEGGQKMRSLGIDKHFDIFHISAETKFVKPEPQAFEYFAKCLGVEINEFIFIDDSPKSLSTAKECGFAPVLFKSYESLVSQLKSLRVI